MNPIGSTSVAGYHFALFNQSSLPLVFDIGFNAFLKEHAPSVDRNIFFHEGFIQFDITALCYQAKNNDQLLWEIVDTNKGRWFLVYHPENGNLQQQAQYDKQRKSWTIRCQSEQHQNEHVLNPLAYPMAPLLWYQLTTEEPLLLIHASGIFDGEKGRIFAGFSGVGKSTMAKIWQQIGAQIINDDRLLIKKENDGTWRMYNTPMYYQDEPKSAKLQHIYFPHHHTNNTHELLLGAKAIAQLLAFTIHHGYDIKHLLHHSRIAEELLKDIGAAKLGVVPNEQIVLFIKANE